MASSPWPPAPGAAPAPLREEATAAASTTSAAGSAPTSEHLPVKEGGVAAAAAVSLQQEEEAKPQLPRDDDSEAEIQEHEQKINKYRAILAACLKSNFFSRKAFDGGHISLFCFMLLIRNIFEAVTVVQGGLVQNHLRTQKIFVETRTTMRRALHRQHHISPPRRQEQLSTFSRELSSSSHYSSKYKHLYILADGFTIPLKWENLEIPQLYIMGRLLKRCEGKFTAAT